MEQILDVSDLEPPEPLERILDALADMAEDDWLLVRHRRNPVPLYRMLADMGYQWRTDCLAPGRFEILIWPDGMPAPDATDDGDESKS